MCGQAVYSVVIYSGAIIVQEEKLRLATKRFPSFFQRAMAQLSLGVEYLVVLILNRSWREVWRRYELMRRSQLNQHDCMCISWLLIDSFFRKITGKMAEYR